MNKNTICLWYHHDAEAAARFYAKTFPNSAVGAVHRAPADFPGGKADTKAAVRFQPPSWQELRGLSADERRAILDYFTRLNSAPTP